MQIDDLLSRIGLRERIVAALVLCGGIFYLDSVTAATFLAAALYIPVAAIFYGVRSPSVFLGFCVLCTALSAGASLSDFDEADFINFAINRGLITLVLYSTCLLIYRNNCSSEVLRRLATTDSLTGAFNRRYFMELMAREQRRADRYETIYTILMIVARYGGEEFVVTLTHTDQAGALKVAERLREAVSQIAIPTEREALTFTVSVGVGTYRTRSSIDEIIGRADQALYRAKTAGRNRVCVDESADPAAHGGAPAADAAAASIGWHEAAPSAPGLPWATVYSTRAQRALRIVMAGLIALAAVAALSAILRYAGILGAN
jgi:GGDEF domain-containing protein